MIKKNSISLSEICLTIKKKRIFHNLSINFSANGLTIILGPNGSGKTLLTKVILGLTETDNGEVKILNENNGSYGYAPQKITFLRRNVFDNIAFPMIIKGFGKKTIFKRVNYIMKKFGIYNLKNMSARNLSGGLSQFVSFIRAIVNNPMLLILDEPSSNLDVNLKKKIENFLIKEKSKRKIIMVTHDLFQARRLADEIILVDNKGVLSKFSKKELWNEKNYKIQNFLNKNFFE